MIQLQVALPDKVPEPNHVSLRYPAEYDWNQPKSGNDTTQYVILSPGIRGNLEGGFT